MTAHLWVGPTLPEADYASISDDVVLHGPARAGSLMDVDPSAGDVLVIADGVYWSTAALQLPEILAVVSLGATFIGVSSYGALRAADLGDMPGVRCAGKVAEMICADEGFTDADVALVHDAEKPYRARSLPLVNLIVTLHSLSESLSERDRRAASEAIGALRRLPLQERTWSTFAALLSRWQCSAGAAELFRDRYVDQKRDDLLAVLADPGGLADARQRAVWQPTVWWERRLAASHRVQSEVRAALAATRDAVPLACDSARLAGVLGQAMSWWVEAAPAERLELLVRPRTTEELGLMLPPVAAPLRSLERLRDPWLLPGEQLLAPADRAVLHAARSGYVPPALRLLCRFALVAGAGQAGEPSDEEQREWALQVDDLARRRSVPRRGAAIVATDAEVLALMGTRAPAGA